MSNLTVDVEVPIPAAFDFEAPNRKTARALRGETVFATVSLDSDGEARIVRWSTRAYYVNASGLTSEKRVAMPMRGPYELPAGLAAAARRAARVALHAIADRHQEN